MRIISIFTIALALTSAPLSGQTGGVALLDGSRLWVSGTSTIHAWTCRTTDLEASVVLGSRAASVFASGAISKVDVAVPVTSLKCGRKKMDDNLYKAMRAKEFPTIAFSLTSYTVLPGAVSDSATLRTLGRLTIAGTSRDITMDVRASRDAAGILQGTGEVGLLMTDFGIRPPVVMGGLLKTGNMITVGFDVRSNLTPVVADRSH